MKVHKLPGSSPDKKAAAQSDAAASASQATCSVPFSFRLPRPGTVDPHFGAARTFWNQHVLPKPANGFNPPIKSIVERQPRKKRGIRFILYNSARAYFETLAMEQCAEVNSKKEQEGGPRNEL